MKSNNQTRPWTKKEFEDCLRMKESGMTYAEISKKVKRTVGSLDHALRASSKVRARLFHVFEPEVDMPIKTPEGTESGAKTYGNEDYMVAESTTRDIKTLEQLIERCEIDLSRWSIESWRANVWQVGVKQDDGKVRKENLYQVKANLKKIPLTREQVTSIFQECLRQPTEVKYLHARNKGTKTLEISIPDLHLGKLAWEDETGHANYDSEEAERVFKLAVEDLITRVDPEDIKEIILPIGNDYFNVDSKENMTANGTPQNEDGRWQKSFRKGCQLATWAIKICSVVAPVKVIIVSGNHDTERCFYLGEFLSACFSENKNVEIDNSPTERKYCQVGSTLLCFTHGDRIKLKDLTHLAQVERRELWGQTKYCEWHLGHLHRESTMEEGGVIARVIPSLCPPDAWHSKSGYVMANRGAQAFLYDGDTGLECIFYHRTES
jgi:predicted phosphodiesterase